MKTVFCIFCCIIPITTLLPQSITVDAEESYQKGMKQLLLKNIEGNDSSAIKYFESAIIAIKKNPEYINDTISLITLKKLYTQHQNCTLSLLQNNNLSNLNVKLINDKKLFYNKKINFYSNKIYTLRQKKINEETNCIQNDTTELYTNNDSAEYPYKNPFIKVDSKPIQAVNYSHLAPLISNQINNKIGVCWAVSTALTIQYAIKHQFTDLENISKYSFSPMFLVDHLIDQYAQRITLINALNFVEKEGICFNKDYSNLTYDVFKLKAKANKLINYNCIVDNNNPLIPANNVEQIKNSLINQKIVLAEISYYNWTSNDDELVVQTIVIIGFDDTKKSFSIINNWGMIWGNSGRGELSYEVIKDYCTIAYEIGY